MDAVVEVRGLVNRFGSQLVHDGLDMRVSKDEVFGIVGGSGSGKSVLLRSILGLQRPQAGEVKIDGHDITRMTEAQLRPIKERYGVAFQSGALYSGLTVLENVQLPAELAGRQPAEAVARSRMLLDEVGLLDRATSFPDRLSGGEQQRVAIARALVQDPPLLLADEPTGNLDDLTGRAVMSLLQRVTRDRGRTLVLVTHSAPLAATADRVFAIEAGRLVPLPDADAATA